MNSPNLESWNHWRAFRFDSEGLYVCAEQIERRQRRRERVFMDTEYLIYSTNAGHAPGPPCRGGRILVTMYVCPSMNISARIATPGLRSWSGARPRRRMWIVPPAARST